MIIGIRRAFRLALALALALAVLPVAAARAETDRVTAGPAQTGTISAAEMDARLEKSALAHEASGEQFARIELFDVAQPGSTREYKAMAGYSIVLIVAVTQDAAELPLRRIYLRMNGGDAAVRQVFAFSRDTAPGTAARRMFGRAREFAFFLVPTTALAPPHQLLCDLSKTRRGLVLSTAQIPTPDYLTFEVAAKTQAKPSPTALYAFLTREYPGLTAGLTQRQLQ